MLSYSQLFATLWTVARQAPLFVGLPRQEYRSGLPCPLPGDLLNSRIEPKSPTFQADSLPSDPSRKPKNTGVGSLSLPQRIFLTQESNQGLLHCRQVLYKLSHTKRHASIPGSTRNRDGPPSLQHTQLANPSLVPIPTGTGWPGELRNLSPQPGQVPGGAFGPENAAPTRHPSSITLSAWAPCIQKASQAVQTLQTPPARAGDPG